MMLLWLLNVCGKGVDIYVLWYCHLCIIWSMVLYWVNKKKQKKNKKQTTVEYLMLQIC